MNNIQLELPKEYKEMFQRILTEIQELKQELNLQKSTQKLLNRSEASKFLGITWQQLRSISYCKQEEKEDKNKKLPYIKVGKNYSYLKSDLEEYKKKIIL